MFAWVQKIAAGIAGKKIKETINLKEGTVETKKWYTSKTIWTAIVAAVLGILSAVGQATGHPVTIPSWVYDILAAIGVYSLRTADKPIG